MLDDGPVLDSEDLRNLCNILKSEKKTLFKRIELISTQLNKAFIQLGVLENSIYVFEEGSENERRESFERLVEMGIIKPENSY